MLSSKPVNAKLINCMKSTLIFQINCNKSNVLCWRVNSTSYTSPVLAFNKGFLVATKINCIPLIWLFRVTVASATPSPSGPFNILPVTEKPITWKTGWNGKKLTSVFTQEMQTHTYSNQHQLFSLHTHIKETLFPAPGKKCTRTITVKVQTDLQAYYSPKYKTHILSLSALGPSHRS